MTKEVNLIEIKQQRKEITYSWCQLLIPKEYSEDAGFKKGDRFSCTYDKETKTLTYKKL